MTFIELITSIKKNYIRVIKELNRFKKRLKGEKRPEPNHSKFTLDYVIDQSRQSYPNAVQFVEFYKSDIEKLYPMAYFEVMLNIKTRNQCELTDDQRQQLLGEMEYFFTKKTRYTSDSAMVANFLTGKFGERAPKELREKLINYLYKDNTSFGFVFFMVNSELPLEEKYTTALKIFNGITNKIDKEKLTVYINELPTYNSLINDNIIIKRLQALQK